MSAIICQLNYPRCKSKNLCCSVDAHFQNGAGCVSLSLLRIKAADTSFMNIYIQLPLRLPKVQDQKSSTSCWLSFSGWGRDRFSLVFDHKGGWYIRKGQRYTNVNILWLAIGYLNPTINRNTRIPEPEIGTDGSRQIQLNGRVDGYGSGFGPPRCSGSGFWSGLEPNPTVSAVRTLTTGGLPGPVANTTGQLSYVWCTYHSQNRRSGREFILSIPQPIVSVHSAVDSTVLRVSVACRVIIWVRPKWETSAQTKSRSLYLFGLLYPQTQENGIEVHLKYGIAWLFQSDIKVIAMLLASVTTTVLMLANVRTRTWWTVHTSYGNITNHVSAHSYIAQVH